MAARSEEGMTMNGFRLKREHAGDGGSSPADQLVQLVLIQAERRDKQQGIAQRTHEQAVFAGAKANLQTDPLRGRKIRRRIAIGCKVERRGKAALADFPNVRMRGERLVQAAAKMSAPPTQHAIGNERAQLADILQGHGCGQRVAGEGVTVEKSPPAFVRAEKCGKNLLPGQG